MSARLRTFAALGWRFPVVGTRMRAAPPERWLNKFRLMPGFSFGLPDDEGEAAAFVAGATAAFTRAELRIDMDADAAAARMTRYPEQEAAE